jgi:hypothetical protein
MAFYLNLDEATDKYYRMLLRVLIILDIVLPKIGNKGILSGRWELST